MTNHTRKRMKTACATSIALIVVVTACGVALAQAPAPVSPTCLAESSGISAAAAVSLTQTFLIFDIMLTNRSASAVSLDPGRIVLLIGENEARPLSADQAKRAVRDVGGHLIGLLLGPLGLVGTIAANVNFNRQIDARILRAGDLAPGATLSRSLFFSLPDTKIRRGAVLIGLNRSSGDSVPPLRLNCTIPAGTSQAASPAPAIKTVSLAARAAAGPVSVDVTSVELSADATALEVTIQNSADVDAEVFAALANSTLTDGAGVSYPLSWVRSEFSTSVPARGSIRARLVYPAVSQQVAVLTLTLPGVRLGEADYDLVVPLRLIF